MELFLLYLWLKLDLFSFIAGIGWLILLLQLLGVWLAHKKESWDTEETRKEKDVVRKKLLSHKGKIISLLIFLFVTAFMLPSSKQLAVLVGASYALDFAKSDMGNKVRSLLVRQADKLLNEALEANKK
jgi:hypothetical protein